MLIRFVINIGVIITIIIITIIIIIIIIMNNLYTRASIQLKNINIY